jgi:hypothetical protein
LRNHCYQLHHVAAFGARGIDTTNTALVFSGYV